MTGHTNKSIPEKSSDRRRGTETSATRAKLVDCTRKIILEDGYAGVSARKVAARAEVKPPLVHYYFPSMDDLFVAVIHEAGNHNLTFLKQSLQSNQPLQAIWKLAGDKDTAVLSMQYLALATHRPAVRAEVKSYAEQLREIQTTALNQYLHSQNITADVPPLAAITIMTAISNLLQLEQVLDISLGHDETKAFIDKALRNLLPTTP